MNKIELSIEIPADVVQTPEVLQYLKDRLHRAANDALASLLAEDKREREYQQVLESDEAMERWRVDHGFPPVVRASTYRQVKPCQEIRWHHCSSDPRRPVVMRGSVWALQNPMYGALSDRVENIVERYMRRIKFTSLDNVLTWDIVSGALRRAQRLYRYHRSGVGTLCSRYVGGGSAYVYVDGKLQLVGPEQLARLKKLNSVIQKTERLERQIEAFEDCQVPPGHVPAAGQSRKAALR